MKKSQANDWARVGLELMSSLSDPNSESTLIDVWVVNHNGLITITDQSQDAMEFEESGATIQRKKMYRKVYEALPEFEGY